MEQSWIAFKDRQPPVGTRVKVRPIGAPQLTGEATLVDECHDNATGLGSELPCLIDIRLPGSLVGTCYLFECEWQPMGTDVVPNEPQSNSEFN